MNFFKKNLSLQAKLIFVVIANLLVLIITVLILYSVVLSKSYLAIEKDIEIQNIKRAEDTIKNISDQLVVKLTDWSSWDDTYVFAEDQNLPYIKSNLGEQSIANLKINAMFVYDSKNKLVFRKMIDFNTVTEISSDNLFNHIVLRNELLTHNTIDSTVAGLIMLPEGPMVIASKPILTSSNIGPAHGTLIFGKFLDKEMVDSISELTRTTTEVFDLYSKFLPQDVLSAKVDLLKNNTYLVKPLSTDSVAGYKIISDLYNNPMLVLKIETPRQIYNQGKYSLYFFITTISILIAFFGLLLIFSIRKLIVNRISSLSKEVDLIGDPGNSVSRVTEVGYDEIGRLATEINSMVSSIESAGNIFEKQAKELKKFQLAVENASDQIVITDMNGIVIYGNPAVEKITGFKPSEAIGKKAGALWKTPMPVAYYEDMWDTIKNKKQTFTARIQNKRKNGQLYFADINISPVLDDQGDIIFFVAIEHDITKEKEIETNIIHEKEIVEKLVVERTKELKQEQARLLASINSIPFGFIIANSENEIILSNSVINTIFGVDAKEIRHISDISKFFGESVDLTSLISNCLKSKVPCKKKQIMFNKKILRGIISPVIDDVNDESIGYVFILEDISEAVALERSRDEFFSIASHELRTPLTAIRGNSQMLLDDFKDKIKDKDVSEMIRDMHESSARLIDIVNDFLEVSHLEQGKVILKKENFSISDVILKVVKEMEKISKEKGIEIIFEPLPKKESMVYSDKAKVEQVLFNLLGNALKFTKKGDVIIKVNDIHDFLKISVIDHGVGISESNQVLLFRKFQQASDNILARDFTQGTGLGLYISHLIISQLGGTIDLEKSVPGEGSTFAFTLPVGL